MQGLDPWNYSQHNNRYIIILNEKKLLERLGPAILDAMNNPKKT